MRMMQKNTWKLDSSDATTILNRGKICNNIAIIPHGWRLLYDSSFLFMLVESITRFVFNYNYNLLCLVLPFATAVSVNIKYIMLNPIASPKSASTEKNNT